MLVLKLNGKVRLYLGRVRLNQTLIRPVHNIILQTLNNAQYHSPIDVSSGYHTLKLDEKLSYLTTFAWQLCRSRYKRLPFGVALTGDIIQRKLYEIFKDLQNVFGIADDILFVGYDADGKYHDDTILRVLHTG